jgi:1-acyl-sn-glycerol-3-phosphate acyltransferase
VTAIRRAWRVGRGFLSGTAFLGAWIGSIVLSTILFPLSRLRHRRRPAVERAAACQRWLQRAFVLLFDYMRLCTLIRFNPRRLDTSLPGPRFVMVANHPTLVDQCALSATFGRIICVAKPLLFRVPFVGRILRACNYLEGGESEGLAGGMVVNQALERIAQSMPLLVFPEGTRSPVGGLRRFRRGPFEIACRANAPVVPILIRCEPLVLAKGMPWYDVGLRTAILTVTRLPVMHPAAFGGDAGAMTAACEATFRRHLGLQDQDMTPVDTTAANHE